MYQLSESADYPTLCDQFLTDCQQHTRNAPLGETPLIVPTLPVGNVLIQTIASRHGVASGISPYLWRTFEWILIERVTGKVQYGSQAPLSNTAIHWALFGYFYQHGSAILADSTHHQHELLRTLYPTADDHRSATSTRRLWVHSGQLANLYTAYLAQRPEWVRAWQSDDPPPLDALLHGNRLQNLPQELADHYRALYQQQSRLWHDRFAAVHAKREARVHDFWQKLDNDPRARRLLPPWLPVFAPTQLSSGEYQFMRRLGDYTDLTLYHLAASDHYIDDLVDSRWLRELKRRHPAYAVAKHYDHGHALFSRYSKQQRALARLLHPDSTEQLNLNSPPVRPHNLLSALQAEIRSLQEGENGYIAACLLQAARNAPPQNDPFQDDSLRIHGCHGLQRQCETLRSDIAAWLNADPTRRPSDIYIHLPDPNAAQAILRATFPSDSAPDGYYLPARLVGINENRAETLWRSLVGRYTLLDGRFDAPTVLDWLRNEDTCHSLGISAEQMQRISAALVAAGYRRGFDGEHLQKNLHEQDHDYRYSYNYALDRLIAGVLIPDAEHYLEAVPQDGLTLADLPALEALATLATQMHELRALQAAHTPAQSWLQHLRDTLRDDYAHAQNDPAWQTLDQTLEELENRLAAHQELAAQHEAQYLPLNFILEYIESHLAAQQTRSEPGGAITIGSLKNLRNLPGKLLVFLNADREHYPARQNDDRYNLIHLDEPRPGDSNREHEDLGALLDLINRAENALWIYYNSAIPGENTAQPPASPIQELLQYLDEQRERADEQLRASGENDAAARLPHYHLNHPADPFQPDAPYENTSRPAAPLWRHIRHSLEQPRTADSAPFLPLAPPMPLPAAPQQADSLTLAQLSRDTLKPASAYARAQQIANTAAQTPLAKREALVLDNLAKHQAEQHIIAALEQNHPDPAAQLARLPLYPGGISGKIGLEQSLATYRARAQTLLAHARLAHWPTLAEQTLDLGDHNTLTAYLPSGGDIWPRLSASKAKPKHQYRYWLEHLAWSASGNGGTTLIHYADDNRHRFQPLPASEAIAQLRQWLALREQAQQTLWLAPIELMQPYRDNLASGNGDKNSALIRDWLNDDWQKADDGDLWRHLWRGHEEESLTAHIAAMLALHAIHVQPLLQAMQKG